MSKLEPLDHPVLFIPGPVEVDHELREVLSMPIVGHRSAEFMATVRDVSERLGPLFLTERNAYFETCAATALMEAAVRNLTHSRILHLTCGAFGERWAEISALCGRSSERLSVDWGRSVSPDALRNHLRGSDPYEAVCVTHSETSTGVLNPLSELARVVREESPETLVLVDAVSSLGGAELRFDAWGLDLVFAGVQKALALPPGLTVFALSERAVARAGTIPNRGFVLDFAATPARFTGGKTPATPCVPLVYALRKQLERIEAEGLKARWSRHLTMQSETAAWAKRTGFEYFSEEGYRSPTVSTLRFSGREPAELVRRAAEAGFTLTKGYGAIKETTFRIGHMGDHPLPRLQRLLNAIA